MEGKLLIGMLILGLGLPQVVEGGLYDNFDSYPTDSELADAPGWYSVVQQGGASAAIDEAVSYPPGGKSVHFDDSGSGPTVLIDRDFAGLAKVRLEYYIRTADASTEGVAVELQGDVGADYKILFRTGSGGTGWIGVHSGFGWLKSDLLPYTENTWYYVRRDLDCVTDTGRFYVEQVDNPSNNATYEVGRVPQIPNSNIDRIRMGTSNSLSVDGYIDDVSITPEPATLALLALGGLGLMRRRRR